MGFTETKHFKKGETLPAFTDDKLVLLSMRFCPYAQRVHLVLDSKRIPHNIINVNLNRKPKWLYAYSRLGKVPALGLTNEPGKPYIYESIVISDYLDEKYPQRQLHSKDPLRKAKDVLLIKYFDNVISAFYNIPKDANQPAVDALFTFMDVFEIELVERDTTYFGGEIPGMLDYMIWPWFERRPCLHYPIGKPIEFSDERFSKLNQWTKTMIFDEAVQNTYISADYHTAFIASLVAGKPAYELLLNIKSQL